MNLPVEPDFPVFWILSSVNDFKPTQPGVGFAKFSFRIYFSHDFFSLVDIHKASEEIANVNNTKIEKIRLHLIEV